ncbi:hypothetical protein FRC04_008342 [Tulasnella sp. 424]|nr:hypothetical protein FRC04_008342 [Tulasnella sp. 424]KAG8959156.1 hypothetical protein FRC05_008053 [Tulasnella sp. 425]
MARTKQRHRSQTPNNDSQALSDASKSSPPPTRSDFADYFSSKDAPGKQVLVAPRKTRKATKAEAAKEALAHFRPTPLDDDAGLPPKGRGSKKGKEKATATSALWRKVGSICLYPRGLEQEETEIKIPNEELKANGRYGLKVSNNSDGSPLKINLNWSEDELMEWVAKSFPIAHDWLAPEVLGSGRRWCEFVRRRRNVYIVVTESYHDLEITGAYLYGTLATGQQSIGRLVFVSSVAIPKDVYQTWGQGPSRKRRFELATDEPATPGLGSRSPSAEPPRRRRNRIEDSDDEDTKIFSKPRKPSTMTTRSASSSKRRASPKAPPIIVSDSDADIPGPSTASSSNSNPISGYPAPATPPSEPVTPSINPTPGAHSIVTTTPQPFPMESPTMLARSPQLGSLNQSINILFSDPIEPDIDPYAYF